MIQVSPDWKDVIGPIVSVVGAAFSYLYYRITKRTAAISVDLEAQKMLLEMNRQLISDPLLWSIYDDNAVRQLPDYNATCTDSVLFQAKLDAFAYMWINMFEIVLVQYPKPMRGRRTSSNAWLDFFSDTLKRSSKIRKILDRPETAKIFDPILFELYGKWKNP